MAQINLTTEASLEKYLKRINEKINHYNGIIKTRKNRLEHDSFLQFTSTTGLANRVEKLMNVKELIQVALKNPNEKIEIILDQEEAKLIHQEEHEDN